MSLNWMRTGSWGFSTVWPFILKSVWSVLSSKLRAICKMKGYYQYYTILKDQLNNTLKHWNNTNMHMHTYAHTHSHPQHAEKYVRTYVRTHARTHTHTHTQTYTHMYGMVCHYVCDHTPGPKTELAQALLIFFLQPTWMETLFTNTTADYVKMYPLRCSTHVHIFSFSVLAW